MKFRKAPVRRPRLEATGVQAEPMPQEQIGEIQGIMAASVEEWRVAKALWELKVDFTYQSRVRGGNMLRGGQTVDFLVFTPWSVPVQVFGDYWHTGRLGADDSYALAELQQYFGVEPVVLWARELVSHEETVAIVKRELKL